MPLVIFMPLILVVTQYLQEEGQASTSPGHSEELSSGRGLEGVQEIRHPQARLVTQFRHSIAPQRSTQLRESCVRHLKSSTMPRLCQLVDEDPSNCLYL